MIPQQVVEESMADKQLKLKYPVIHLTSSYNEKLQTQPSIIRITHTQIQNELDLNPLFFFPTTSSPSSERELIHGKYEILLPASNRILLPAAATSAFASSSSSDAAPLSPSDGVVSSITGGFFASLLSRLDNVSSLLAINPFYKLSADDFSGETPWTTRFFGMCDSYSFPLSSQQARMIVHENIKLFTRNYAMLFIVLDAACVGWILSKLSPFGALFLRKSVLVLSDYATPTSQNLLARLAIESIVFHVVMNLRGCAGLV
ncbi:unnamed protein product [Thlaspi arvense]|uniref:Uncharacterized protein n=1 Tax=Thlaspi arvense TaxID=13288 RepID=A0AAU9RS80_THLAR|nr:unnamed protein product [Thlaspi arvense]